MKKFILYITFILSGVTYAQIEQGETTVNREEDFTQESVTVERNYEPKVEAAEKIKQTPEIQPSADEKISVEYSLRDVEAESDFETSTLGAEELPLTDQSPYNNYIRAGYGNRASLHIDGFGEYALDDDKSVGASVDYRSTNGFVNDEIEFSTNNSKLDAEGFFKINFENAQADVRLGGGMHKLNYYGLPADYTGSLPADVTQLYTNLYVGGKYSAFNHLFLDEVQVRAGYFGDKFDAAESNFDLFARLGNDRVLELNTLNDLQIGLSADLNLNFANTEFKAVNENKYAFLTTGIAPQLHFQTDILKVSAGANLQYNSESERNDSEFYIFPKVQVFVTAVPEFGFYGGITGAVNQNRYQTIYNENPFLLPSQQLAATVNKMEVYAGIRGDIGTDFKYDASAKYQNLENIPFFSRYMDYGESYMMANSFNTIYDNGKRTAIEGNVNYLGVNNLDLGANLLVQTYSLDNFDEAWGKPGMKATISADYKFLDDRLILGGDIFYVEKRKFTEYHDAVMPDGNHLQGVFEVDPYVDLNLNATYLILERWAAFIELNNALNKNYDRFVGYPVQGITVVGGVMFKF